MGRKTDSSLQIKDFYERTKDFLELIPVLAGKGLERRINSHSFVGDKWSVEVWGRREVKTLQGLSSEEKRIFLKRMTGKETGCIVLTEGLSFFPELVDEARRMKLALFRTAISRKKCRERVKNFFASPVLSQITIPGGMLRIFGCGILISGDSGIGKSESALELISRGHKFISDDVTQVKKTRSGKIIGQSPALSRYFMEIRGLGVINIREIFGEKAVCLRSELNLIIQLKKWEEGTDYDRLGLEFPEDHTILGQKIPQINIPVAPGRNIATLIEIACRVHILREKGYFAPREITRKLERALNRR